MDCFVVMLTHLVVLRPCGTRNHISSVWEVWGWNLGLQHAHSHAATSAYDKMVLFISLIPFRTSSDSWFNKVFLSVLSPCCVSLAGTVLSPLHSIVI